MTNDGVGRVLESAPPDGGASLASILRTDELRRRPSRPPDHAAENRALATLVASLADAPHAVLQTLADTMLGAFGCGSAGVSLLTPDGTRFVWPAVAGLWRPHVGGGTRRDAGPCGDVLDRGGPLAMARVERRYPDFLSVSPAIEECLLVPFAVAGRLVGTVWLVSHDERRFDAEDLRQLESVARFAGAAHQATEARDALARRGTELRAAEGDLRHSEGRFRALFDQGPVAIYSCDADGTIQEFNATAAKLWGRAPTRGDPAERYCGSHRLYTPDGVFLPHDECPVVAVLSGKLPFAYGLEVVVERPDGSRIDAVANIVPLKDARGEVTGVMNCLYDITERRAAEEASRRGERSLKFVMETMPQKVFTARPDGGVDSCNPQWLDYAGLTFAEIADWGWAGMIHPDDLAENVRLWQHSVDSGEPFEMEHRFRRADGEYRWHLTRVRALRDPAGGVAMWVGSNTDVHEQREAAGALRQLAADLAAADRHKDEFLATLAHELRNPLAPIRNALHSLRLAGGDAKTTAAAAEMMERHVGQMVRLVDDLLDVSRVGRGKVELRAARVELAPAVLDAVEATRSLYQGMGHEVTVTLPPRPVFVDADATRVTQVVGNLLNNACKFTDRGGRVGLTVAESDPRGTVEIRVRDSGVGIAPDQLARVFEMFAQVDSSLERSSGGLGIGLTLVKSLVELHGGTVEVRSDGLGRGSEFVVRLPVAAGEAESPAPQAAPRPAARRILVVDDNRDAADSLATILELTGHETRTAYDGLHALAEAEDFRPDVVLMDLGMPKLNGYDAARRIRHQPWAAGVQLVALTGWGQDDDRQRTRDAGFDRHLVKPVAFEALTRMLADLPAPA